MTPEQICEGKKGPFKWFIVYEEPRDRTWVVVRTRTNYRDYLIKSKNSSFRFLPESDWHYESETVLKKEVVWSFYNRTYSKDYDTFEELMKDNFEEFL